MDIKQIITDTVEKITKDEKLQSEFKQNPVGTVEKMTGVDLPDGTVDKIVDAVKAKIAAGSLGGAVDKLKGLL